MRGRVFIERMFCKTPNWEAKHFNHKVPVNTDSISSSVRLKCYKPIAKEHFITVCCLASILQRSKWLSGESIGVGPRFSFGSSGIFPGLETIEQSTVCNCRAALQARPLRTSRPPRATYWLRQYHFAQPYGKDNEWVLAKESYKSPWKRFCG